MAGAPSRGMIFLDPRNKVITEYFTKKFADVKTKEVNDQKFAEFDDVTCLLESDSENPAIVLLSAVARCWEHIAPLGAMEVLASFYGPLLLPDPMPGYNVTLRIDVQNPGMEPNVLIDKVASIRTVILGAPLYLAFRSLTGGESMPAAIPYRGTDVLYTIPRPQHVAVIFLLNFEDVTEKNIARIIAQEFVENQPKVGRAPPVSFSIKDPPAELLGEGAPPIYSSPALIGFISFSVMAHHVDTPEKLAKVVSLLIGFRTYMSYHIKATKSFIHARMRSRVEKLLQVLNRAVPEDPFASKAKKLISGKTFTRK